MRRIWTRIGAIAGCLLLAAIAGGAWTLTSGFAWLSTGKLPRRAELMVVLAGGSGERFATALQLWQAGLSRHILVTDGFGYPDLAFARLRKVGVPARALVAPRRPSNSTHGDALAIRQVIIEGDYQSILVVTSPYHCRRTELILHRVLAGMPVQVTVTASVSLYMDPERWWSSRQGWITVGPEFPKLFWAWMTVPMGAEVG